MLPGRLRQFLGRKLGIQLYNRKNWLTQKFRSALINVLKHFSANSPRPNDKTNPDTDAWRRRSIICPCCSLTCLSSFPQGERQMSFRAKYRKTKETIAFPKKRWRRRGTNHCHVLSQERRREFVVCVLLGLSVHAYYPSYPGPQEAIVTLGGSTKYTTRKSQALIFQHIHSFCSFRGGLIRQRHLRNHRCHLFPRPWVWRHRWRDFFTICPRPHFSKAISPTHMWIDRRAAGGMC